MRVLVVSEINERASVLHEGLMRAGHEIVAHVSSARALAQAATGVQPDLIVVDAESPTRDMLTALANLGGDKPRPIIMFASDAERDTIREAVRAGVTAYIVDGLELDRIKPIVDVAMARFEDFQGLRSQLAEAQSKLSERKLVERAKGLIMQARKVSEAEAYAAMRELAMNRGKRLADVARQIIDAADLLT